MESPVTEDVGLEALLKVPDPLTTDQAPVTGLNAFNDVLVEHID